MTKQEEYYLWCVDFVEMTDVLRNEGRSWLELSRLWGSECEGKVRNAYHRAKVFLLRQPGI